MIIGLNLIFTFLLIIKRPFYRNLDNIRNIILELFYTILVILFHVYDTSEREGSDLNSIIICLFIISVIILALAVFLVE